MRTVVSVRLAEGGTYPVHESVREEVVELRQLTQGQLVADLRHCGSFCNAAIRQRWRFRGSGERGGYAVIGWRRGWV